MNTKKSGGPPVRGATATKTRHHHEAGPSPKFSAPGRQAERIPAGHGQYALTFDDSLTTADRFERFHEQNPHVYRLLTDLARRWKIATGGQKLGIRTLWEQLRWQLATAATGVDYKLNDHFTSFYARLIERQEPDLRGLFELRKSPEADAWIARVTA
jgi:hypothetical protein